jgi:uncharacterized protein YjbI with pentapeptide repeats
VREAHKQYSETLNKTILVLLGVALFCLLTTLGSPDKLLLGVDSTIKIPFADAPLSFFGFIVVTPCLLIVLATYLHVFYGYWLACERERQYLNQILIPPIESIPALFSFPGVIPRVLTWFIFYGLVPLVLGVLTWKAWALPAMGRYLTYVVGFVIFVLVLLQFRRRSDNQWKWWTLLGYTIIVLIIPIMVQVTINPQSFQRPLNLFRTEFPKAWLVEMNMRHVYASLANLEGANLEGANLEGANLQRANLRGVNLQRANLEGANLQGADLDRANLQRANLQRANLQRANLPDANLQRAYLDRANLQGARLQRANLQNAKLQEADLPDAYLQDANLQRADLPDAYLLDANLQDANLQGTNLRRAFLQNANLEGANLQGANLQGADLLDANLQDANLQGTNLRRSLLADTKLQGANLEGANLEGARLLTQDQVEIACVGEYTRLPTGLRNPLPCPAR